MPRRRDLLRSAPLAAALGSGACFGPRGDLPRRPRGPADEEAWTALAHAFAADRSITYLNNGGVSIPPRAVQEAHLEGIRAADGAPAQILWSDQERGKAEVRTRLARLAGCQPEDVALVRNASEGLELLQLGIDLEAGDEVVHADQDYPRMRAAWRQRERREGIRRRVVRLPGPEEGDDAVVEAYRAALGPRTRVVFVSQVVNLTGRLLPVARLAALARDHGALCIVDGAHGLGHFPFDLEALGVDLYATSLHKWVHAPTGTGMLMVRGEARERIWPLLAADEALDGEAARYEQLGTHPVAPFLAVLPALDLLEHIGLESKAARLRTLRDRWLDPLLEDPRVRLMAPRDRTVGIATIHIEGASPQDLHRHLWGRHRIRTSPIATEEVQGVRVSPGLHTLAEELEQLVAVLQGILEKGLPPA
jgi:isopenicillin-N epimerase